MTQNSENIEEDLLLKSKKIVFYINPENIKYIESLPYQQKHAFINKLIAESRNNENENYKLDKSINLLKRTVIMIVSVLIGIPLLFFLLGVSLDLTKSSYLEMQKKFEKLF